MYFLFIHCPIKWTQTHPLWHSYKTHTGSGARPLWTACMDTCRPCSGCSGLDHPRHGPPGTVGSVPKRFIEKESENHYTAKRVISSKTFYGQNYWNRRLCVPHLYDLRSTTSLPYRCFSCQNDIMLNYSSLDTDDKCMKQGHAATPSSMILRRIILVTSQACAIIITYRALPWKLIFFQNKLRVKAV